VGRRSRGDHERSGRRGGGPERGRERPEGGADRRAGDDRQDEEIGYKDRVHERLDRMDQRLESLEKRLERHLKGGEA
jgi:hypothetical protein